MIRQAHGRVTRSVLKAAVVASIVLGYASVAVAQRPERSSGGGYHGGYNAGYHGGYSGGYHGPVGAHGVMAGAPVAHGHAGWGAHAASGWGGRGGGPPGSAHAAFGHAMHADRQGAYWHEGGYWHGNSAGGFWHGGWGWGASWGWGGGWLWDGVVVAGGPFALVVTPPIVFA